MKLLVEIGLDGGKGRLNREKGSLGRVEGVGGGCGGFLEIKKEICRLCLVLRDLGVRIGVEGG